jgi:hypothetical protein
VVIEDWSALHETTFEGPERLGAYLRSTERQTASAADRKLFQAPFRAGIRLDAYQLLPLAKALDLPRVNLLIADDVGLGKTIEAGLIVRELLLRRRVDFVVVAAPASMLLQWQDELSQPLRIGSLSRSIPTTGTPSSLAALTAAGPTAISRPTPSSTSSPASFGSRVGLSAAERNMTLPGSA